jgi:hypothetical protein
VRYTGSGSSFIDTGLTNGTTYFYKIWAKDTRGNYAATAPETSGTPRTTTVRGAAFNTIMWQGSQPAGTAVKFQIASSNCSNGATNPPTCDTGTWTFRGPDGTASTFYAPAGPNVPVMLNPSYHNNHRYVRYRIYLQPDASNTNTPRVDDVIITWSR